MSGTERLHRRTVLAGLAALAGGRSAAGEHDLARLVGQTLLVGFAGAEPDDAGSRRMLDHAAAGRIGGVLLLDRNIRSAAQVRRLTAAIAAVPAGLPLLIAVDQEGGAIQRLGPEAGFTRHPAARTVGRGGAGPAARVYDRLAGELAWSGVNMNLGPVVDLARDGGRGVIGRLGRSFSADPAVVTRLARAFTAAHAWAGIVTSPKHFPGHGNTAVDSHRALPDISATWREAELAPYRALIAEDAAPALMTGHLVHPRFSDNGLPASLSARTTRALRRDLGFDGVIVTDDLQMQAVRRAVGSDDQAAVRALAAGADLMIFSGHPRFDPALVDRVHRAVADAVTAGRLPVERVAAAHARVLALKRRWLQAG